SAHGCTRADRDPCDHSTNLLLHQQVYHLRTTMFYTIVRHSRISGGPPVPTHHPNAVPSEVLDAVDAADAEARGTTLVAGTSFCVCEKAGDIEPDRGQGLFVDDTRVLSTWRLSLDGQRTEGLSVIPAEPFEATYVGRGRPRRGHDGATRGVERPRLAPAGRRVDRTLPTSSAGG